MIEVKDRLEEYSVVISNSDGMTALYKMSDAISFPIENKEFNIKIGWDHSNKQSSVLHGHFKGIRLGFRLMISGVRLDVRLFWCFLQTRKDENVLNMRTD